MFTTGDKVVHPGHGPGVIRGIERRRMLGEEKQYYIIDMVAGSGTLMTPVAKADEIGLRPAISNVSVKRLLNELAEEPATLPNDFRERQNDVEERLKEGDVFVVARVIRDLAWYGQNQGLTKRDSQLMQRAEELVAGELALVKGIEIKEALDQVQAVMETAITGQEEI
jgi:CarD family transcriptional regulator